MLADHYALLHPWRVYGFLFERWRSVTRSGACGMERTGPPFIDHGFRFGKCLQAVSTPPGRIQLFRGDFEIPGHWQTSLLPHAYVAFRQHSQRFAFQSSGSVDMAVGD